MEIQSQSSPAPGDFEARVKAALSNPKLSDRDLLWILLAIGGLTEADVRMMLRGGLINAQEFDMPPCQIGRRDVYQIGLSPPPQPLNVRGDRLACPLQERAAAGDDLVPCSVASSEEHSPQERSVPPPRGPNQAALRLFVEEMGEDFRPCTSLGQMAGDLLMPLLHAPAASQEDAEVRGDLFYLIESGRMDAEGLAYLIGHGIITTDRRWFPCERDYSESDAEQFFIPRCPLHARLRLGQRGTVPCAKAEHYDHVYTDVRLCQHLHAMGLISSWPMNDLPADPEDPVHKRKIRPCYLLGRLLMTGLVPLLQQLFSGGLPGPAGT